MINRSIALVAVLLLMACTHHRRVSLLPRDLLGETVEVKLRDGSTTNARAERTPRGIVWRTGKRSTVAWRHLRQVTEVSHGRGALDGLGIGAAAGVSSGILLGLTADDTCGDPNVDGFCLRKQDIKLLSRLARRANPAESSRPLRPTATAASRSSRRPGAYRVTAFAAEGTIAIRLADTVTLTAGQRPGRVRPPAGAALTGPGYCDRRQQSVIWFASSLHDSFTTGSR